MDDRENWAEAGLICGHAYADEVIKLGALAELDAELEKTTDKEAAHALLGLAAKVIKHPATRAIGFSGLAGGAGLILGKKQERTKAEGELVAVAPDIFRAGFNQGVRAGFVQARQQEAGG